MSEQLVGSFDIYPTILDAANIKPSHQIHGRSLKPILIDSSSPDWRQALVAEFHYHGNTPFFPRRAITDGRFKLIHNLRAGELSAAPSVDGDQAHILARQLKSNHPARLAMERLTNPPEWELYDLKHDPIEFDNLSEDSTKVGELARLKQALREWQEQTGDPFRSAEFREAVEEKYRRSFPSNQ